MFYVFLAQLPTPTPFASSAPLITLNRADFSIWKYTDEAIQLWRMGGDGVGLTIQVVAIVVVIALAFFALAAWIRTLNTDDGSL